MKNRLAAMICLFVASQAIGQDYDPLTTPTQPTAAPIDLAVTDSDRKREIPLRVYLPAQDDPAMVILLSHGLGGSRRACGYAAEHWSRRGFAVIAMQHAGSDETVWKDAPVLKRMAALKAAASIQATTDRFADVKRVIDQLQTWNKDPDHAFHRRFDLEKIGMSGHSYGAQTTQGVSGQSAPLIGQRYTDRRIDAAVMFSPNKPRRGDPKQAFGKVSIPWMLMTGTQDTSPINDTTVEDRRAVYPALPDSIDRYEVVLFDAQHSAFGDTRRPQRRNANHHRVILALSTAFWDAHLRGDEAAKTWLTGNGPKTVLEPKDLWQHAHPKAGVDSVAKDDSQ